MVAIMNWFEGAIKNGNSRYTGNIGYKKRNEDKQNKTQHRNPKR
jgi:hypothetical protein